MKTNRYLMLGLALSLAINLALVGFLAGRASNDMGTQRLDPMMGMRVLFRDLADDRREVLMPHFREYFRTLRPRFRGIRGAQAELHEVILGDPLDEKALAATLMQVNAHFSESQANSQEALVALITALSHDERRRLVTYLKSPPSRREHRSPERRPRERRPPETNTEHP